MNIRTVAFALIASAGLTATAQADNHMSHDTEGKPTITDIVVNSDQHTTLETALKRAGLAKTLSAEGRFTVFAPTDDAFAVLPEGTLETLLKPENSEQLKNILTYHVIDGYYLMPSTLAVFELGGTERPSVITLNGEEVTFHEEDNTITVKDAQGNKAKVTMSGIKASNGVVHVIDGVLMP